MFTSTSSRRRRSLSIAVTLAAALGASLPAIANELGNPGFEDNPPSGSQNNVGHSIAPWILGTGNSANVVKVDGDVAIHYGSNGPEHDASGAPDGTHQHYLDIANGSNDFYQSFTPECSGEVTFGGFFSTRANSDGDASVTIREGVGTSGPIVGTTNTVSLDGGDSQNDPWTEVSYTASITAGTTYSFIVFMDNNMNFDEGFVEFTDNCGPEVTFGKTVVDPQEIYFPGDQVMFAVDVSVAEFALQPGEMLTFTDSVPPGMTLNYTNHNSDWSCSSSGGIVTCTYTAPSPAGTPIGDLSPVILAFTLDDPVASGTIENCAELSGGDQVTIEEPDSCASIEVRNRVDYHLYNIKYVCGIAGERLGEEARDIVAEGVYRTEINIMNPDAEVAELEKRVLPLVITGDKVFREPDQNTFDGGEDLDLRPYHATFDDCRKIGEMQNGRSYANEPISIGFLSIFSPKPIDVDAVYTTGMEKERGVPVIEVERVTSRVVTRIE